MTVGAWVWPGMIRGITEASITRPIQAADRQLTVHHRGVVVGADVRAQRSGVAHPLGDVQACNNPLGSAP
jgi:hypothetical protein